MSFLELPRMGETMEEGEILVWMKKAGDSVKRGETVAEIQTDKIVAEMPALEDFVLEEILAAAGTIVKVGQPLARIRRAGETAGSSVPAKVSAMSVAPTPQVAISSPVIEASSSVSTSIVRASPAARRAARELNVNLSSVTGTGPRGRVTTDDIRNSGTTTVGAQRAAPAPEPAPTVGARLASPALAPAPTPAPITTLETNPQPANPESELHRLTRIEIATGKTTVKSKTEIPHFYVRSRADLTGFMRGLEIEKARGSSASVNDAIVKAVALALKQHPRLNAVLEGDAVRLNPNVHIGVMTATADGLVTSVVRNADTLSLPQINASVKEIRARAAAGRARAEDISGAGFCISNLGMFGVEEFSAIILPPNVAILAVGAVLEEVVADNGAIRVAKTVRLTVSADHRAVDGVEVALFLQSLRKLLEQPHVLFG
jgi:pyruvate dehydrogenase E2 component (dihydrolipoamide acetyltransferase)